MFALFGSSGLPSQHRSRGFAGTARGVAHAMFVGGGAGIFIKKLTIHDHDSPQRFLEILMIHDSNQFQGGSGRLDETIETQ